LSIYIYIYIYIHTYTGRTSEHHVIHFVSLQFINPKANREDDGIRVYKNENTSNNCRPVFTKKKELKCENKVKEM